MRPIALFVLAACGPGFTGRVVNSPDTAKAFSCSGSEPHPEYDRCFVERGQCDRYVAQERGVGAFVSDCVEQTRAFCFAGYERDAPVRVWQCSSNHDVCGDMRERVLADRVLVDLGSCVEKVTGQQ